MQQKPQTKEQVSNSEPEYLGIELASGASSGTAGAMAAVTRFSGNIISPKFKMAYATEIPGATQPDSATTSTPTSEGLVVVQTKSTTVLAARKPARDKKKSSRSTHRRVKRARVKSSAEPPPTASVCLPLPVESTRSSLALSPRLRRSAAVAACQRL